MFEILFALLRPPVVTSLVLGTHQAVGTATTVGRKIQVATAPLDRIFHVTARGFGGLEGPTLPVGISQEAAEFSAMRTPTSDVARPCPIAWRLQRFGDACTQVLQASGAQALNRRQVPARRLPRQTQGCGYDDGIQLVGLGPGQDMVRRTVS